MDRKVLKVWKGTSAEFGILSVNPRGKLYVLGMSFFYACTFPIFIGVRAKQP